MAVLLGVEFNAETERTRELREGGRSAEKELKVPERDRAVAQAARAVWTALSTLGRRWRRPSPS